MDFKKEFGTNKALEEAGVWVDIGDGAQLKIARAGSKKALKYSREVAKPYMAQITYGKLPDDVAERLAIEVLAECILLDWKTISYDGKPLPYSKENALKLMTESEDFRDMVSRIANERKTFQQQIEEAIIKN